MPNDVEIRCPACNEQGQPAASVGNLVICNVCGTSLAVNPDGTVRLAVADDTVGLDMSDLARLRNARASIVRHERKS